MTAVDWLQERLSDRYLFDQHCLPPQRLRTALAPEYWRRWLLPEVPPEALRDVPLTLTYRMALRWLAELLGCDPTEAAILEARATFTPERYERLLADDARLGPCCTPRVEDETVRTPSEWSAIVERPVATLLPIESLAERLLPYTSSWDDFRTIFAQSLAEALATGAVGLVSDFPLRTSLAIHPVDMVTAERSFHEVRAEIEGGTFPGLLHRSLLYAIFWQAFEVAAELTVPIQIVLGTSTARDPHAHDPVLLRPVLDEPRYRHVPIVLIGRTRLHPRTVDLVRTYPQLYCDPGPSLCSEPGQAAFQLRDLLSSVPTTRLLASTGGQLLPERQWFVARLWRRALYEALGSLVEDACLTLAEAETDAIRIMSENAQRLYRFPS